MQPLLVKRYRRERRFHFLGKLALGCAGAMLVFLLAGLMWRGGSALLQTRMELELVLDPVVLGVKDTTPEALAKASYHEVISQALVKRFPEAQDVASRRELFALMSRGAKTEVREWVMAHPEAVGKTVKRWVPASDEADMYMKRKIDRLAPEAERAVSDRQIAWLEALRARGEISKRFNTTFFSGADSREPELAGGLGSIVGSLLAMLACLALAFPLGVMAAVYLQEFAPSNRVTDMIEININNLAAVPSIIFGLLGLAVYLHTFGLPRSSALAGGLTLALMILPTIIIATRTALRTVPDSIRDAARALGATPLQVVLHHALPLAMPGIMTGTILGIARALGETAPLLMIGMVAFVADVPQGLLEPATAMPVQIFLWADSPELAFQEKTALLILVLLVILMSLNATAVWIRKKFERKW